MQKNLMDALSLMQVIYVMRNPKDVFTSSFHYYGMTSFMTQPGLQSEFLQKFLDGTGCWPWLMHSIYLIKGGEWCSHLMINSYFNAKLDVFICIYLLNSANRERLSQTSLYVLELCSNCLDTPR